MTYKTIDERWSNPDICNRCQAIPPKGIYWEEDHVCVKGRGYTITLCDDCRKDQK